MADQVFCKNCRHSRKWHYGWICKATTKLDPVYGKVTNEVPCRSRNANLDCELFEKHIPLEYDFSTSDLLKVKRRCWRWSDTLIVVCMVGLPVLVILLWVTR